MYQGAAGAPPGHQAGRFLRGRPQGAGVTHEASCVFTARGGGRGGDGRPPGRRHCHRSHGRRDLRLSSVCPAGHPDRARSPHGTDRHPRQRHSHPAGLRVRDWLRVPAWLADRTDDQLRRWFHRPVVVPAHVSRQFPRHRLPRVPRVQLVVRGRQRVHHLGPEFPAHRRGKRQPVLHQGHRAQRCGRRARDPRDVGRPRSARGAHPARGAVRPDGQCQPPVGDPVLVAAWWRDQGQRLPGLRGHAPGPLVHAVIR